MLKGIFESILNGAGQNLANIVAVSLGGLLATGLGTLLAKGYKFLLKRKIAKYIAKFVPNGIALGDLLKGTKPNEEALFQAVLRVENLVLKMFPLRLRPTVDRLIDSRKIARDIERALNEDKTEGLAKAPALEE